MDSPGQTRPSVYRPTQLLDKFDHVVFQFIVVTFKVKVLCEALVLQPSHKTAKSKILTHELRFDEKAAAVAFPF